MHIFDICFVFAFYCILLHLRQFLKLKTLISKLQKKYTFIFMYLTEGRDRQFEIYKTGIEAPGFRDYHEKLQTFILFFIDAASFIDVDDERWQFFLLYVVHNIVSQFLIYSTQSALKIKEIMQISVVEV